MSWIDAGSLFVSVGVGLERFLRLYSVRGVIVEKKDSHLMRSYVGYVVASSVGMMALWAMLWDVLFGSPFGVARVAAESMPIQMYRALVALLFLLVFGSDGILRIAIERFIPPEQKYKPMRSWRLGRRG